MKKEDAQKLVTLVNNKENMDALSHYMNLRVDHYKDLLTYASNYEEVRKYQGAIEELHRLRTLREEVLNPRD